MENEIEESVSDEEWMKRGSGYASEEVYYFEVVIELDRLITWKWNRRKDHCKLES